jgi:hypothetical protein
MKKLLFCFFSVLLFFACNNDPKHEYQALDLLEYGIPMSILAPDSAEVKTMDMGIIKDVSIKKGKDYYVQIFSSEATTTDVSAIKSEQLDAVKNSEYFSQIISEDDKGFIYENMIDSTRNTYGFRYVRVQGDKEYVFQTGLIGMFTLEDVQRMYECVEGVK